MSCVFNEMSNIKNVYYDEKVNLYPAISLYGD